MISEESNTHSGENGFVPNGNAPTTGSPIPIAIVGMACRFGGGVTNPSKLWELCVSGEDGSSPIPKDRFDPAGFYHEDPSKIGRSRVKSGYFIKEGVTQFDAAFFNLMSDVANASDPQLRQLLETVYEATEDAGIPIEKLSGSNTAVYSGNFYKDYQEMQMKDAEVLPGNVISAIGTAMMSNRISHFFNLQGPSMTVDTGCSGGMVAVHLGCQSVRCGESHLSIVGASSLILAQDIFFPSSSVLGADGKCYAWDERAHGYGRGEGVAALILQPLDAALRDGNQVHAVIRETALNQDGRTVTITSPSAEAQAALIQRCYSTTGFNLADTGYVEAHMTGTAAGDTVEAEALAKTFGKARRDANSSPMIVGSVKTNVGHTEPVSGLAAIIKTVFVLKNQLIPPNLNYKYPNPAIPQQEWHVQVPTKAMPWPKGKRLRASVNNFGYGGTNGHMILDAAPAEPSRDNSNGRATGYANGTDYANGTGHPGKSYVYILSAKDSTTCGTMMSQLAAHIDEVRPDAGDLAFTLAERRSRHSWVSTIRAKNIDELVQALSSSANKPMNIFKPARLGFVFNGQGAQWHAMGRDLIGFYPVFTESIRKADAILKEYGAPWSLEEELMRDASTTRVGEIQLSQPVSVALQLCLCNVLSSWGILPTAVTSHSSGEIAAAYALRALSFKEALGVAYFRGEVALKYLKQHSLQGGMLATAITPESAQQIVANARGRVVVACVNSPNNVTLSGDEGAIDTIRTRLTDEGVFARKLQVPMAYHSHHMSCMERDYIDKLRSVLVPTAVKHQFSADFSEIVSSSPVTGERIDSLAELRKPEHWARNMTSPVLFSQAFDSISKDIEMVVEIGAHNTLYGPIREILKAADDGEMPYVSCLKRGFNAVDTLQDMVCDLISHGCPVNLTEVNQLTATHKFITGLPSYPWNHTRKYWMEPRVSRENRYKRFPPHELLGSPMNGANGLNPTWRNFLRLTEIPWLNDHQVDGSVVFPAAGYIACALESARLVTDPSEEIIHGYRLRDIDIMTAMIIPDSSAGVEIQFTLRPCSDRELDHDGWWQFQMSSVNSAGKWIEHCAGVVSADTDTRSSSELRVEPAVPQVETFLDDRTAADVDTETLFASLRARNAFHGPAFQNLIDNRASEDRAITTFAIAAIADKEHNYILHPTTLDSIFQSSMAIHLLKGAEDEAMVLPRHIQGISLPPSFKRRSGQKLRAFSESVETDYRGYTSTIAVVAASDDLPQSPESDVLQVEGFFAQVVHPRDTSSDSEESCICATVNWELDVLHNLPAHLKAPLILPCTEREITQKKMLDRAAFVWICNALAELDGQSQEKWEPHHRRLFSWMKNLVDHVHKGPQYETSVPVQNALIEEMAAAKDVGSRLVFRVGRNLAGILKGDINPLELMMEGQLLSEYYSELDGLKRSYYQLGAIVELFALKNPGANVLEIGAGTGGATTAVLEGFKAKGHNYSGSLLGHYTFTDLTVGFLEGAKAKFAAWSSFMDYKRFDIEVDPLEQGFTAESYDLVVASYCIHATRGLQDTLTNVRKVLKPGGTLLLIEGTTTPTDIQLIFGTLPGWWLGIEPERQDSPNVSVEVWDKMLKASGFTGIDLEIVDVPDEEFEFGRVMASRALTEVQGPFSIVLPMGQKPSDGPVERRNWLSELAKGIGSLTGVIPEIVSIDNVQAWQDTVCVFVAEMEHPVVDRLDADGFEKLRTCLLNNAGLLWLSCGGTKDATDPAFGAADGLIRTMRQEEFSKRWVRLDFGYGDPWATVNIDHSLHVIKQSFHTACSPSDIESEFAVSDSVMHVNRVFPDKVRDALAKNRKVDPTPESQPYHQDRPLILEMPNSSSGIVGFEEPYFVHHETVATTEVPSGFIEIEAKAFGLNFRDVLIQLRQLEAPKLGHECSGIVTAMGLNTERSGLKVGDRVCAALQGRIASRGRAWWPLVAKIPDSMSWEEGASIPAVYTTAYLTLKHIAKLQPGESVLVHTASGGTGQAAIVVAQSLGAEVFATCSTKSKRQLLMDQYGIPEQHFFSSRDASFAPALKRAKPNGIDVALNTLSGPLLNATWDCMAAFGRFIDITALDMQANRHLEMKPFARGAMYVGFQLSAVLESQSMLFNEALVESISIVQKRGGAPMHPITPYSISEMIPAMRQMQGGQHMGKLVIVPRDGDQVKVVSHPPALALDRRDATYLIAGGLGGIGRVLASWFIEHGAKNLIVLSRSASKHEDGPALLDEAKAVNCRLVICDCDLSDEQSFVSLMQGLHGAGLPPVRGAINAAMVLNDSVLETMTFEQWDKSARTKIDGSHNLHKHLPDMEFFIMLSSASGCFGNSSQSNYAAGNTYQDALARHRTAQGLPAVSYDLGAVDTVGFLAKQRDLGNEKLRALMDKVAFGSIDEHVVLRMVEAGIRDPMRKPLSDCQIVVGPNLFAFASGSAAARERRFGTLRITSQRSLNNTGAITGGSNKTASLITDLKATTTVADAAKVILELFMPKLADMFSISQSDMDPRLPLSSYGVDSLTAVELRNWISGTIHVKVSLFEVLQTPSLLELATLLAGRSEYVNVQDSVSK